MRIHERSSKEQEISYVDFSDAEVAFIVRGLLASLHYLPRDLAVHDSVITAWRVAREDRNLAREILEPQLPNNWQRRVLNSDLARQLSAEFMQQGKSVGFIHGHFRIWTRAHFAMLAQAQKYCDELIVGIEDGFRTAMYKDFFDNFTEAQRLAWLFASGFNGCAMVIRDEDFSYSDAGYEALLKHINPTVYLGPESSRLQQRADACGIEYIALPKQSGLSSREVLNTGRP